MVAQVRQTDLLHEQAVPAYTLRWDEKNTWVFVGGIFDHGLTAELVAVLTRFPEVSALVLESDGGQIYEARGVAQAALERSLDTYVFGLCKSACTTAFLAGKTRYIGPRGVLGFHRYHLQGRNEHPFVNIAEEQERDRQFYLERGVNVAFSKRLFSVSHRSIWVPTRQELLAAGVVHVVLGDARK